MKQEIEIPEGHEAKIEGNRVVIVPKESEDEIHRKWILEYLYDGLHKADEQFKDDFKAAIDWLEKQKENRWVPSDEQRHALGMVLKYSDHNDESTKVLESLLDDLTKIANHKVAKWKEKWKEKWEEQKPVQANEEGKYVKALKGLVTNEIRFGGERVKTDFYLKVLNWLDGGHMEQKPAEWSYPYGIDETADRLISIAECLEMDDNCLFNGHSGAECGKFLRELARKQIGCKPADWSKEDEQFLLVCKNALQKYQSSDKWDAAIIYNWLEKRLKSLRTQPKQEWGEEDKENIELIATHLDNLGNTAMAEILLNLRPQPHWKPSEKQLSALERCVDYLDESYNEDAEAIGTLCHDLKNL